MHPIISALLLTQRRLMSSTSTPPMTLANLLSIRKDTSTKLLLTLRGADLGGATDDDEGRLLEEAVHLLEGAALGFGHEEPEEEGVGEAADGEDDVVAPADVLERCEGGEGRGGQRRGVETKDRQR